MRISLESARSAAAHVVRVFTLAGLLVHFGLTILFCSPANPVRLTVEPLLVSTIGTFFPQNWSLFAPNPVTSTQTVMVRCLDQKEVPAAKGGPLPEEGWADLSSPLFVRAQHNRLSAYERLVRPQENALRAYLSGGLDLQPLRERCLKGEKSICESLESHMKVRRDAAGVMLRKLGSVYCRESHPLGATAAVAMRYRERSAVPWSERHTGTPKSADYELGVYDLDRDVTLPDLFTAGGRL